MTFARHSCGGCGSRDLITFLDLGSSPLADAFPASPDEPEVRYPLRVAYCGECFLAQLIDVVPDNALYGADYGFYTGASPSSRGYFAEYAEWVRTWFPTLREGLAVEVASNDGTLLRLLQHDARKVVGVEPAAGVARVAQDAGLEVLVEPFGREAAAKIVSSHGYADLIIANNVVAHVSDLHDFLGGISALLRMDGRAIIEFQYVADLLTGNQFDHVYHEHRFFFSRASLSRVMERHGLVVRSQHETPAQGGSLRVVVGKGAGQRHAVLPGEKWLTRPAAYLGMQGRVDYIRTRLLDILGDELDAGRRVAGFAASAKSTTLLNYCRIGTDYLFAVEDKTPYKIGRYTPGTHIPIVEHAEADTYLLMAWNYLSGVLRREPDRRFIVPIPQPVIL